MVSSPSAVPTSLCTSDRYSSRETNLPTLFGLVALDFEKVWKDITVSAYANSARECEPEDLEDADFVARLRRGAEVERRTVRVHGGRRDDGGRQRTPQDKEEKHGPSEDILDRDKGAVIGANAMLYKDVLFDLEGGVGDFQVRGFFVTTAVTIPFRGNK